MSLLGEKVVVVTGAAGGIGSETARQFAVRGAKVCALDLDIASLDGLTNDLKSMAAVQENGGSVVPYKCDVTSEEEVTGVFEDIVARYGSIQVLVNNAGITQDDLIHKLDYTQWQSVIETNLTSTYLCSKSAQRHMVPAKYGKIVNLSSRSALGNRGQANYSAAKAGIQGLTASLAIELGQFNINVNAVAPGFIATKMTDAVAERLGMESADYRQKIADQTPLRRVGSPEDVANLIRFLASDEASYVSGQTIYINGGAR